MPSPVAHSLIGLSIGVGWLLRRGSLHELVGKLWRLRWPLAICVFAANAPDLDYLPGIAIGKINAFHHTYTHTFPFVVVMAWILILIHRGWPGRRAGWWLFGLGASHLAADLVTADRGAPYGIMALWPMTSTYYISPVTLFWHLRKSEWSDFIQLHNGQAVLVELVWCLPLLFAVLAWKTNRVHLSAASSLDTLR